MTILVPWKITQQVPVAGPMISQDLPEDWDDVKLLRASTGDLNSNFFGIEWDLVGIQQDFLNKPIMIWQ